MFLYPVSEITASIAVLGDGTVAVVNYFTAQRNIAQQCAAVAVVILVLSHQGALVFASVKFTATRHRFLYCGCSYKEDDDVR